MFTSLAMAFDKPSANTAKAPLIPSIYYDIFIVDYFKELAMLKRLKQKIDAGKIFVAACIYLAMVFLNNVGTRGEPFSSALYFALIHTGNGLLLCSALFLGSLAFSFSIQGLLSSLAVVGVLSAIYGLFGRKKQLGIFSVVFLSASLIPYILSYPKGDYQGRFFTMLLTTVLAACFVPAVRALTVKGFRRPENYEALSLALIYVCVWAGGVKYVGLDGYKAFSVFALACIAAVTAGAESCTFALVLAMPAWLATKNALLIPPYMLYGGTAFLLSSQKKPIFAAVMLAAELSSAYLFGWYGSYTYVNLLYFCAPLLVFVFLPDGLFKKLAVALAISADKPLPRYEINRTRTLFPDVYMRYRALLEKLQTFSLA